MALRVTALTDFADNGNSKTFTYGTHTAAEPKLVIQKRKVPTGNATTQETSVAVIAATKNAAGDVLPSKVVFEVIHRSPIDGLAADVTAALGIIRDIIAGDEYTNAVSTQEWI